MVVITSVQLCCLPDIHTHTHTHVQVHTQDGGGKRIGERALQYATSSSKIPSCHQPFLHICYPQQLEDSNEGETHSIRCLLLRINHKKLMCEFFCG